ncbi:hypothetical protein PsorP6_012753 [Peronosclerospora sorghi]|uniref:Uncharacterized protein n=1 Tax=Peronosclerospora sorghi TaxID=230839 RepID=A0ACC0WI49_9STRA|nr:hypothetical protein PsorP6_012753 [Peronosclerospora sorghi]
MKPSSAFSTSLVSPCGDYSLYSRNTGSVTGSSSPSDAQDTDSAPDGSENRMMQQVSAERSDLESAVMEILKRCS